MFLRDKPIDKPLLLNIIVIYEHLFVFVCANNTTSYLTISVMFKKIF